jgi:hypothetical protein
MRQSSIPAALILTAFFAYGCASKDDPNTCSNLDSFAAHERTARAAATTSYAPPSITPCSELDPPLDEQATSPGLTFGEYEALLRGANGNFFDDHTWWLKATPRGAASVVPVKISAERCEEVTFAKFGYDYAFATPPLAVAPECGRYLTGMLVGHQLGDSWPAIFGIDGSGVIRLAPLSTGGTFGPFLRLPRSLLDTAALEATLDRIDVVTHDGDSLELGALVNGPSFASAARLVLKVGDPSRLSVQLEIDPRAAGADGSRLAVAALSGWFSNTADRDFDRVRATFSDGTSFEMALSDAGLDWGTGKWTPVPLSPTGALESLAFLQNGAGADGSSRPNVTLSNFQSSQPLAFGLSLSTRSVLGGNVIANLSVDSSAAGAPISVSYLVTVAPP